MQIKGWANYMNSVVSLIESPFEGGRGDVKIYHNIQFCTLFLTILFDIY
jgi:hypothetical protein